MSLSRQFLKAPRLLSQCQRLSALSQQRHASDSVAGLSLTFISPSDVYYKDEVVKQVDVQTMNSSFGILQQHVPTLATLVPGVLTVFEEAGAKKFFVSSGSVTVNSDSTVQILAEEAHPMDRFDQNSVSQGLEAARRNLEKASMGSSDAEKAEAQIAVDCLEVLSKAVN